MTYTRRNLFRAGAAVALAASVGGVAVVRSKPAHAAPDVPDFSAPPDPYASYVGQSTCDPTPKPGVLDFQALVLEAYPDTGDLGISRDCGIGGTSEHKEGRAWDWAVDVNSQSEIADELLNWLLEERDGEPHALLRRFGIMYMIWNRQIWKAYEASAGWQAYTGSNPHTDHVHLSFSWEGARQETTWWTARGPGGPCDDVVIDFDAYPDMARGEEGDLVKAAQCQLLHAGFEHFGQKPTGTFGTGTVNATKALQAERGLQESGKFDAKTWTALLSTGSKATVQNGSRGTSVSRLQRSLTAALGRTVEIDGIFGSGTEEAVKEYQTSAQLESDGIVGELTWSALQAGKP